MSKESETPSGIRLMLLLKEHLREIMNRECANQASIHLYCTGSYCVGWNTSVQTPLPDPTAYRPEGVMSKPCNASRRSPHERQARLYPFG